MKRIICLFTFILILSNYSFGNNKLNTGVKLGSSIPLDAPKDSLQVGYGFLLTFNYQIINDFYINSFLGAYFHYPKRSSYDFTVSEYKYIYYPIAAGILYKKNIFVDKLYLNAALNIGIGTEYLIIESNKKYSSNILFCPLFGIEYEIMDNISCNIDTSYHLLTKKDKVNYFLTFNVGGTIKINL